MLVADAVTVEPVSAGKFPANREINREFLQNSAFLNEFEVEDASKSNGFR
jgi:hypothetical protein